MLTSTLHAQALAIIGQAAYQMMLSTPLHTLAYTYLNSLNHPMIDVSSDTRQDYDGDGLMPADLSVIQDQLVDWIAAHYPTVTIYDHVSKKELEVMVVVEHLLNQELRIRLYQKGQNECLGELSAQVLRHDHVNYLEVLDLVNFSALDALEEGTDIRFRKVGSSLLNLVKQGVTHFWMQLDHIKLHAVDLYSTRLGKLDVFYQKQGFIKSHDNVIEEEEEDDPDTIDYGYFVYRSWWHVIKSLWSFT